MTNEYGAFEVSDEILQYFAKPRRTLQIIRGQSVNMRCSGVPFGIDERHVFRDDSTFHIEAHDGNLDDSIRFPAQSRGFHIDDRKTRRKAIRGGFVFCARRQVHLDPKAERTLPRERSLRAVSSDFSVRCFTGAVAEHLRGEFVGQIRFVLPLSRPAQRVSGN